MNARAPIFHCYDLLSNFIKPETISDAIDIKQELPDDNYEKMDDCDENLASNDPFLPFFLKIPSITLIQYLLMKPKTLPL